MKDDFIIDPSNVSKLSKIMLELDVQKFGCRESELLHPLKKEVEASLHDFHHSPIRGCLISHVDTYTLTLVNSAKNLFNSFTPFIKKEILNAAKS